MIKLIKNIDNRKVGFTGTRKGMTLEQKIVFTRLIDTLNIIELHHGGCLGADGEVHEICAKHPNIKIVVWPLVKEEYELKEKQTYLKRNRDIVKYIDVLIACPYETSKKTGGVWYTIRYARKLNKEVYIINSDGSIILNTIITVRISE